MLRNLVIRNPQTIFGSVQTLILHLHRHTIVIIIIQHGGLALIGSEQIDIKGRIDIRLDIQSKHQNNNGPRNQSNQQQGKQHIKHIRQYTQNDMPANIHHLFGGFYIFFAARAVGFLFFSVICIFISITG